MRLQFHFSSPIGSLLGGQIWEFGQKRKRDMGVLTNFHSPIFFIYFLFAFSSDEYWLANFRVWSKKQERDMDAEKFPFSIFFVSFSILLQLRWVWAQVALSSQRCMLSYKTGGIAATLLPWKATIMASFFTPSDLGHNPSKLLEF